MALKPRAHQAQLELMAQKIIGRLVPQTTVVLDCTPGGGKSGAATSFANMLLDAGKIDSILWFVPRCSLASQVEVAYRTGYGCRPDRELSIWKPGNELFPSFFGTRGEIVGHVLTYQAIQSNKIVRRIAELMRKRKTLIIPDEVQFLRDAIYLEQEGLSGGWYANILPLSQESRYCLPMSGTLWRTDNHRIPCITYTEREDGLQYPHVDIRYSLRDAVADGAVIPLECHNSSGTVSYTFNGKLHIADLQDRNTEEEGRQIKAFLANSDAVCKLLDRMVDHWREWRKINPRSRMLIIADDQVQAERWATYMRDHHATACSLAIAREKTAGRNRIEEFRTSETILCLSTVRMAYVGFDCPDITHLAYLSAIRAPSYMLQSFSRPNRVDYKSPLATNKQKGFVFTLDDPCTQDFCDWIRSVQELGIQDIRRRNSRGTGNAPPPDTFNPISAEIGDTAIELLAGEINPCRLPPEMISRLAAFRDSFPEHAGIPIPALYQLLAKLSANTNLSIEDLLSGRHTRGRAAC